MADSYFEFLYHDGDVTAPYVGSLPTPDLERLLRGELVGWTRIDNVGWLEEEFGEWKVVFLEDGPTGTTPYAWFRAEGIKRVALVREDVQQWRRDVDQPFWEGE